jgi:hypothetical protein
MSFLTEWALAVHRAVWFPLLWMTGLEADAVGEPLLDEATTAISANNVDGATANCPGCRSDRPSRKPRHGVSCSSPRVTRRA